MYIGIITRWKEKYFILHDNVLSYCQDQGKPIQGSIHLGVATIQLLENEPLQILINTGTAIVKLKAADVSKKGMWTNAIQEAQQTAYSKELKESAQSDMKNEYQTGFVDKDLYKLNPDIRNLLYSKEGSIANDKLSEIWVLQAQMKEQIFNLQIKMNENSENYKILETIDGISDQLKNNVTVVVKLMEEEKKKLHQIVGYIEEKCEAIENNIRDTKRGSTVVSDRNSFGRKQDSAVISGAARNRSTNLGIEVSTKPFPQERSSPNFQQHMQNLSDSGDEMTVFHSINCEYDVFDEVSKSFIVNKDFQKKRTMDLETLKKTENGGFENILNKEETAIVQRHEEVQNIVDIAPKDNLYERKQKLLDGEVFTLFPVDSTDLKRNSLPVKKDPNQKLNIWELIKDCIGKDLTKIALPVYLNEPLSFTQRFAENQEYKDAFDNAEKIIHQDKLQALGFCLSYVYTGMMNTHHRIKKPFNPLLFETYEYVEGDLEYVTEQVSHHPPISACYGRTDKYTFWGDTRMNSKLGLSGMDIVALGGFNIVFKETGDHIVIHKCKTYVRNLILGTTYVWHAGDMVAKNLTTGEIATQNLKEKGWTSGDDFKADGTIKDAQGVTKYTLQGLWNENLYAYCVNTKEKTTQVEKKPKHPEADWYYDFPLFAFNLNYLNQQTLSRCAPTDSRQRPDQRAYEYGDVKLASSEKLRLEEKQRAVRKGREKSGVLVKPKWFVEEEDDITGELYYKYIGGYWEARDTGNWPNDLEDIY